MVGSILERRDPLPLAFTCIDLLLSSKPTVSMAVVGRDTTRLMHCNRTDGNGMSWVGLRGNAVPFLGTVRRIPYHGHSSDGSSRPLQLALQMCKQVSCSCGKLPDVNNLRVEGACLLSASGFHKVQSFLMDSVVLTTVNHKAESK